MQAWLGGGPRPRRFDLVVEDATLSDGDGDDAS